MLESNKIFKLKLITLLVILVVPFSISDFTDNIQPEKITSDLRFYEINTCSISLFEFLLKNPNVIYQDHYKIRYNNYSSVECFGQITGIDQIGYVFYISIGTNTLFNLFLQSAIWILIISLFKRKQKFKFEFIRITSTISISLLICSLIYSEARFYKKHLYLIDLTLVSTYIYIFVYVLLITFYSSTIIQSRENRIINYFPFLFLFIGLYSGTNFYFWVLPFLVFGFEIIYKNLKIRRFLYIYNVLVFFWSYRALGENYFLEPDKIRGLSLTSYNYLSVMVWSYIFIIFLFGLLNFIKINSNYLDYKETYNNFLIVSLFLISLGYLGSSMPLINFLNYYYFGQTKFGTTNQDLFSQTQWEENIAWRGFFPSAETIGEFFAITLFLFFVIQLKNGYKFSRQNIILLFPIFGLYLSNNKAASFLLLMSLYLVLRYRYSFNIKYVYIFYFFSSFFLIYLIRFENLSFSFEFISEKVLTMAEIYGYDYERSTAFKYLNNLQEKNFVFYSGFLIFSSFAFFINRSELWGLFFARYNPNMQELLFGTGPYSLSNHYSEIDITSLRVNTSDSLGFLLPHSSFLLGLSFFGLFGIIFIIYLLLIQLRKIKKNNYEIYILVIFILINLIKSDSVLYIPSLITYLIFIYSSDKKLNTF